MWADLWDYFVALLRHWAGFLMGALVGIGLGIIPAAVGAQVSPDWWRFAILSGLIVAGFTAWREERRKSIAAAGTQPHINCWQLRELADQEGRRFYILAIRNDGASARFWARFTLQGELWAAAVNTGSGFSISENFHAEWKRDTILANYPGNINVFDGIENLSLAKGEEGLIHLAYTEPERLNPNIRNTRVPMVMLGRVTMKGQALTFSWNEQRDSQIPFCEMHLQILSEPNLPLPWIRRLRIDPNGVHDLESTR